MNSELRGCEWNTLREWGVKNSYVPCTYVRIDLWTMMCVEMFAIEMKTDCGQKVKPRCRDDIGNPGVNIGFNIGNPKLLLLFV